MACSKTAGELAPFCTPGNGTQVVPGQTVTVTWDPAFFNDTSALVQIQADYIPTTMTTTTTTTGDDGFTSASLLASTGSYTWDVAADLLNGTSASASSSTAQIWAQLYIVLSPSSSNSNDTATAGLETRTKGPVVRVVQASSGSDGDNGLGGDGGGVSGTNLVAIVVSLVVAAALLLAAVGWYLFKRRRDPGWSLLEAAGLRKRDGYDASSRRSRAQRSMALGGGGAGGIEAGGVGSGGGGVRMVDMRQGVGRPADGRNVFREEMRRQEDVRI